MAIPALSLLGFMDQATALEYLRSRCLLPDAGRRALLEHWDTARRRLGPPLPSAGRPEIRDVPIEFQWYLDEVTRNPRFERTVGRLSWSFKLVEIAPLLAFQFHVEIPRSASLVRPTASANDREVLEICLPRHVLPVEVTPMQLDRGVRFTARDPNVRIVDAHVEASGDERQTIEVRLEVGIASPLVQAVEFDGRCYLRNGFHRVYGLALAGVTYVPCLLLAAREIGDIGLSAGTFQRPLLESSNPPTCGHFTPDRAYPVNLREVTRVVDIRWDDYFIVD